MLLVIVLGVSGPRTVFSQSPGGTLPTATSATTVLPAALQKQAPESVDDLRAIEEHVQSLVTRLHACTVAVQVGQAQGSGVVVTRDGYVLTAAHVSGRPGRRVMFTLTDGTIAWGTTLGRNEVIDAGLVRIDSPVREWPHAEMADLKHLQVGDWCLVTGHPGGVQPGRLPVLRLGRVIDFDDEAIQTDCELVGGDSGGPVFDMRGQVIGVNSRIGEDVAFNLHVPVTVYTSSWDEFAASKSLSVHRGALLGVQGVADEAGLRLTDVPADEPAGRAGIRVGDILLAYQGESIRSIEQLIELVGLERPETVVRLTVLRGTETLQFSVRLGRRETS
jgi:serine protease Do